MAHRPNKSLENDTPRLAYLKHLVLGEDARFEAFKLEARYRAFQMAARFAD